MPISRFKRLSSYLGRNFLDLSLILIILGIGIFVAYRNYVPGTWLLGWDNLAPELNFKLNIARSLSAVWQEYQGLGLLGGMAHAADLPRQIILLVASIFLPQSFLRYFWTFLMLALGPLGVYFLVNNLVSPVGARENPLRFHHPLSNLAGFVASMFYLFNLATLQTFFTPFETFVSFYGFLPWLLFLAQSYLQSGGKRKLLTFAIVSFLATSAFYVQTLFIVYAIFLTLFAIEVTITKGKEGLFRSIGLSLVTFFVNAFWLLPVVYFALISPGIPGNSHINSIATPETQIMNQARSGFVNIASLKGYWFDYFDWSANGNYDYLYKTWISHSANLLVVGVSLLLFFTAVLGLVLGVTKKRAIKFSYLILLPICYFMLAGGQVPIPFFSEAFRNAFTKWSIPLALILSVGIGSFINFFGDLYRRKLGIFLSVVASFCVISASIYSVFPVFNGNLITGSMRVNIPSYYLDTINYFSSVDASKRIAAFPLTDFWGWQFNDWGYRGSGFLWYGIPQPILSRTFDVWSPGNEEFYNEISRAVISEDADNLKYVLNKYQISHILFDGSIFMPGDSGSSARIEAQKAFLESLDMISKEKQFGKITIYKVNIGYVDSFISAPKIDYGNPFISLGQVANTPVINEDFSVSQGYQAAKNCNLKGLGSVIREKRDGGNYYEADQDGVSCDYFYYPNLSASKAYLMRIKGKNLNGRSLKFYLYSVDKQVSVLEELLPTGDFDKTYYILPLSMVSGVGQGYTLNVETRSFGKVKSENLVTAIEFYPVASQKVSGPTPLVNNLSIESVQKYGTWAYKVDVQGYGLLQLGQGFNSGWVSVPFLEHEKFNGWSNAWVVPPNQPTNQSTIYLVYWPQLLEWGGMLLGVGLTFIIFKLYFD